MTEPTLHPASRTRLVLAFAAVYLIWGSTYFAIRVAIETLPPLFMAGVRFVAAGSILYGWARLRGAGAPSRSQWLAAGAIGAFMLLGGNGAVVWAQTRVPSGLAAVLIASVAMWMALLEWWRGEAARPGGRVALGLVLGLTGVALLVGGRDALGTRTVDLAGAVVLVLGSLSWAWGSLVSRRADLPRSRVQTIGMQMMTGGVLLAAAGAARGELHGFDLAAVSSRSLLAVAYLTVFGAIVAFSAYVYLLRATTPTRAATYAFVNPIVAVLIGAVLGGERIPPGGLVAVGVTVLGVLLLVTAPRRRPRTAAEEVAPAGAAPPPAAHPLAAVKIAPEQRVG